MPSRPLQFSAILLTCGMLALAGCASSGSSTNASVSARVADPVKVAKAVREPNFIDPAKRARATRTGEVYLMRGLMDIFSRGMDVMAARLNRQGVYALSTSYTNWQEIADDLVARAKAKDISYPLIIMGHSLGGNDAPKLATYLGRHGIKVSYVVTFDPTESGYLGKNIVRAVNFYLPKENDNRLHSGSGFHGTIKNVSMAGKPGIEHTTIEKSPYLQNQVIARIMSMTHKKH